MRPFLLLIAVLLALGASLTQARARLQPEIVCWEPDIEFPVACDEDDDD
jgi:hypothetical protein